MTKEEIEKAKELCDKATPGPWNVVSKVPEWIESKNEFVLGHEHPVCSLECCGGGEVEISPDDAIFCAQSRTLLPKALAYIEELEAQKNLHVKMILDKQFNQGLLEAKLGVASAKHDTLCDKLAIAKDAIHDAYGYFRHQNDYYGARMEEALEKIGKVEPK